MSVLRSTTQRPAVVLEGDIVGARWAFGLGDYALTLYSDSENAAPLNDTVNFSDGGSVFKAVAQITFDGKIRARAFVVETD